MANDIKKGFLETMESGIMNADIPEVEKSKLIKNFLLLKDQKINIMVTGATGCGKSSTINALFDTEVAKVGVGVDPETMSIQKYELDNLILWDSPGLGDGKEADTNHARNIIKKLNELDENGKLLIDLVLVIVNGSSRDLGTSYDLINNVIIPNLGDNKENRILVAINQADVAMQGRHWDYEKNEPKPPLVKFLNDKVKSVQRRIKEGTGVDVEPIYYSAGFKEEGEAQGQPYNLTKLLYYIIKCTPKEKRLVVVNNVNRNQYNWSCNDSSKYSEGIASSVVETVRDCGSRGIDIGESIGSNFGEVGRVVGGVVGGAVGAVCGAAKSVCNAIFGGGGGGDCYITTATCEEYGKKDNCYELTMFRSFRDTWLRKQPDGEQLIKRYYATAPALVKLINKQPNRRAIYRYLNEAYLSKCLRYIEDGENTKCKELYVDMIEFLYGEKQKWQN